MRVILYSINPPFFYTWEQNCIISVLVSINGIWEKHKKWEKMQFPFFHNIHYPSSYSDPSNVDIIWSPIYQVPDLFEICHLLHVIRDTLDYTLHILGYGHQVPFFHNIHHPLSYPDNIWSPISQVPKLFWVCHLLSFIRDTLGYNLYTVGYVQRVPFFHKTHHHSSSYPDTVNIGIIWRPIYQVPKLFVICHLLCFVKDSVGYNLYTVGYVQQVPFFHNTHHHRSSYPDTVNIGNIWNPISQVPRLFGICHLLSFIRDTLGYNLYTVRYVQQVPFSHNIHYPTQILIHFLSNFLNFQKNYRYTTAYRNVWSTFLQKYTSFLLFDDTYDLEIEFLVL